MFNLYFLIFLLVTNSHSQEAGDDSSCNHQPIINYNFGSSGVTPSVTFNGNSRQNVAQGRPGRLGPPGALGPKGQKGDKGVSPDTQEMLMQLQIQIGQLQRENIENQEKMQQLRENLTRAMREGYMELEDGWITPFNGYQYKVAPNRLPWDESRRICQGWGADLIAFGFRDFAARIIIHRALDLPDIHYWLGMSDLGSENNFRWVNGHRVEADDITLWRPGEPDNKSGNQDCAASFFDNTNVNGFLAFDADCNVTNRFGAICEKLV